MEDTIESGYAIIYCRVSTTIQRDEGQSIEFQIKECERWAQRNDLKIRGIYKDEAKTGTKTEDKPKYYDDQKLNPLNPENYKKGVNDLEFKDELKLSKIEGISHRPEFKMALKKCNEGDIFICYSLTRLARNLDLSLKVYSYLKEKKVFLYAVKDSLDSRNRQSKLHFQMLSMFSELEADLIKDRVKSGMEMKKEKGEVIGRPSYGWMLSDGKQSDLIPNPKEQEVIQLMRDLRETRDSDGKQMKFLHIAKELNKRGLKTKEGKEWTHIQVIRILNGKCNPKTTKGCKQKKDSDEKQTTTKLSSSDILNLNDSAEPGSGPPRLVLSPLPDRFPIAEDLLSKQLAKEITTKTNDQDLKDYMEFLNFKKMKEKFTSMN
jgi:DNA invertase Pin-like site-specific DNA recombinase